MLHCTSATLGSVTSSERTLKVLRHAAASLSEARVKQAYVAELRRVRTRWLVTKKDRLFERARVWPVGVLLLADDGRVFTGGEAVRAVPPLHPGHVSAERERRRALTRLAYESDLPNGATVFLNAEEVRVEDVAEASGGVITLVDSELHVRWNRRDPGSTRLLEPYLREHIELILTREGL